MLEDIPISPAQALGLAAVSVFLYALARCTYNLYFHPLAKYPGPKMAAISNVWYARNWTSGRYPHIVAALHEKYGDVVRVAPNDLSFATAQSFQDIYGHANKDHRPLLKGQFYTQNDLEPSVVHERDPVKHREVRRTLSHAFSAKSLREQTTIVLKYVDIFMSQIERLGNTPQGINMTEWYNWITFDIIGELSFGESFSACEKAESHPWVSIVLQSVFARSFVDIFWRLPWTYALRGFLMPSGLEAKRAEHLRLSREKVAARLTRENNQYDFFSNFLTSKNTNQARENFLLTQANLLIVAGSETTATTLAAVTYFMTTDTSKLKRLQDEIRTTFNDTKEIDADSTQRLPYLHAVIEEALRLFPPVPFGLPRVSHGASIDGHWVPPGVIVSTPGYTTTRKPEYWASPSEFLPERWLPADHPFYETRFDGDNKNASKPFMLGPRACLGINLAYVELTIILAKMAWQFEWELTDLDVDWLKESELRGLWKKPELHVRFWPRVN